MSNATVPCPVGLYWDGDACQTNCTSSDNLILAAWIDNHLDFSGVGETNSNSTARTAIVNWFNESVGIRLLETPSWITLDRTAPFDLTAEVLRENGTVIPSYYTLGLEFQANFLTLEPGAYNESIVFETWVNRTGCPGAYATLAAIANVSQQDLNLLSPALRGFIYFLFAVTALVCIFFAVWVYVKRKVRIVKAMQPEFLITILVGLLFCCRVQRFLFPLMTELLPENRWMQLAMPLFGSAPWALQSFYQPLAPNSGE